MVSNIATIISAIASICLGVIAIIQSHRANRINDRLLKIEEINAVPSLRVVEEETVFVEYNENSVHFKVFVENISKGIIDIKSVSNLNIHILISNRTEMLRFLKKGLEFPTLLPGQRKQLDFAIDKHDEEFILCEVEFIRNCKCNLSFVATFDIMLGYKDTSTLYKETVKLNGYCKFSISNNVSIQEQGITRSDYKLDKQ